MSRYSSCPHCGRTKTGLDIYKCKNCGRIACYYDGIFGVGATGCWYEHSKCPDCKQKHTMKKVGDVWRN